MCACCVYILLFWVLSVGCACCVMCVCCTLCCVCVVLYTLYLCVNVINVNMPVCMCIQLMTVHACKHSTLNQGLGLRTKEFQLVVCKDVHPIALSNSLSDRQSTAAWSVGEGVLLRTIRCGE